MIIVVTLYNHYISVNFTNLMCSLSFPSRFGKLSPKDGVLSVPVMHSSLHWAPTYVAPHLQVGGTSTHGDDTLAVYLLAQLHTGKW